MDVKSTFKIGIMILLASTLFGCEDESTPLCIQGRVIGYQPCYKMFLMEVLSENLGEPLTLGNKRYERVVQCPVEYLTDSPLNNEDTVYFQYRYFDSLRDTLPNNHLEQLCHPSVLPLTLPTIVVTDYSTENCP